MQFELTEKDVIDERLERHRTRKAAIELRRENLRRHQAHIAQMTGFTVEMVRAHNIVSVV